MEEVRRLYEEQIKENQINSDAVVKQVKAEQERAKKVQLEME